MKIRVGMRGCIAAMCAVMALLLAGVALMLWSVTDVSHWLLWAVPLTPLVCAVATLLWPYARSSRLDVTASVRQQVDRDLQLFRELF